MNSRNRWFEWLLCFLLVFSFSACAKKQVKKTIVEEDELSEDSDEWLESEELDIRGKEFMSIPELKTIYFDYDSSELSKEARDILSENAEYLKKNKKVEFLVEGHCDERGTIGYNLALGQKRAMSVRRYYISFGIKPIRSASLSYGKEQPSCEESTEECWAKNRRVETKVSVVETEKKEKDSVLKERKELLKKQEEQQEQLDREESEIEGKEEKKMKGE